MDARGVGEIVPSIIDHLRDPLPNRFRLLTEVWGKAVGSEQARHSEPYALHGKILFVRVDDSTRAFELSRRYKMSLIRRMQHAIGEDEIKDIVFRVGALSKSHTVEI